MAVYDFSSAFQGLNQGIAALGKGLKDAHDWEQGDLLAARLFPEAPQTSPVRPLSVASLGGESPSSPAKTPTFAAVEGSSPSATAQGLAGNAGGRAQAAMAFLTKQGWTPAQAAGIVGNLQAESGSSLKTDAVGDNGTAFGIAQWRLDRREALNNFARQNGKDPADFMTQLAFLNNELNGSEKFAGDAIRAADTPDKAAVATIHALRPAGYTRDNPSAGHNSQVRTANAVALAGGNPADMPAADAQAAQGFVIPGQGGNRAAGIDPNMKAIITQMVRNPETRAAGLTLWQSALKGQDVKTVDLGTSIGIIDNQGNVLRQIPKSQQEKQPEPFTLSDGQARYDAQGREIASRSKAAEAPTTRQIKQADGSEVVVQWNPASKAWEPMPAPAGGAAVQGPPKLTETQSKDVGFYNRGSKIIDRLEQQDQALTDTWSKVGGSVSNYLKSDAYRQAEQTGREFLAVILRKDTGAAVTPQEMEQYSSIYLPQPADDPETLAQKKASRRTALEGIRMGLGPAEILFNSQEALRRPAPPPQQNPAPPSTMAPSRVDLEAEARRRGLLK